MTLYYETDPADENTVPQLPPLLSAEAVETGDVQAKAVARAAAGEVGLVCYATAGPLLDFAVTLPRPLQKYDQHGHSLDSAKPPYSGPYPKLAHSLFQTWSRL